jgi:5-methylcytosine-specific restriction endonuclease McrA
VSKKPTSEAARRQRVFAAFAECCAYCRAAQEHVPEILEIEHIRPCSRGGSDDEENLCLACGHCNRHKAARLTAIDAKTRRRVALFNPRTQPWSEHFR